jgi:hypothetical protein
MVNPVSSFSATVDYRSRQCASGVTRRFYLDHFNSSLSAPADFGQIDVEVINLEWSGRAGGMS